MRWMGILLLIAGFLIVLAALELLRAGRQPVFVIAGGGVELLGLVLLTRAHCAVPEADA